MIDTPELRLVATPTAGLLKTYAPRQASVYDMRDVD